MSEYLRELDTRYTPTKGTFMHIYVISDTTPLSPPQTTPVNKGKERTYLAHKIT